MLSFLAELVIIVMLAFSIWLYQYAEPFLIVVNILTSIFVISFYLLVTEKLTLHLWKFWTQFPEMQRKIVQERVNRKKM